MKVACKAIAASGGTAIPTVKPWNLETIQEKLGYCQGIRLLRRGYGH